MNNAQHRENREKYVPPSIDEIVNRNNKEGQFTGTKSTFEQRIDNMRMNADLVEISVSERA